MKYLVIVFVIVFSHSSYSQQNKEWEEGFKIGLNDFQSSVTKIDKQLNNYTCLAALEIEFYFEMNGIQFMFTKHFNSKVTATFQKDASYIQAPDSAVARYLLEYSNFAFDLTELYARRLRKELFEEKKFFSRTDYYRSIYKRHIAELNEKMAEVSAKSELGKIKSTLTIEHQKVQQELQLLKSFCKGCIPVQE